MFRFFTPVIILQVFCVYHVVRKNDEQKWIWFILLFPLVGSLVYLYHRFYSRDGLDSLKEEVKGVVINNYRINKLEKELKFSDTISTRIQLADEHLFLGNYEKAVEIYTSCLNGIYQDDYTLLIKVIEANYMVGNHEAVLDYSQQISSNPDFNKSNEKAYMAWSYYNKGMNDKAQETFLQMEIPYTNYFQRLEYAKFLDLTGEEEAATRLIEEMLDEIKSMSGYERKLKRNLHKDIQYYKNDRKSR